MRRLSLFESELFELETLHTATKFVDFDWRRVDFHAQTTGRFVNQVDGLIG